MAAARVRKVFKYPSDDELEDEAPHEGIDEQEQEDVIRRLRESDAKSTAFWRLILTWAIALIAAIFLLLGLLMQSGVFITSALSIAISASFVDRQTLSHRLLHALPKSSSLHSSPDELKYIDGAIILVNFAIIALAYNAAGHGLNPAASFSAFVMFLVSMVSRYLLEPIDFAELARLKYQYKGA